MAKHLRTHKDFILRKSITGYVSKMYHLYDVSEDLNTAFCCLNCSIVTGDGLLDINIYTELY